MAAATHHNLKPLFIDLTADDGEQVSGAPQPSLKWRGSAGTGMKGSGSTARNEPHGLLTMALLPSLSEERLLNKQRRKQKKKRPFTHSSAHGIPLREGESAIDNAGRGAIEDSAKASHQYDISTSTKGGVMTMVSQSDDLPSDAGRDENAQPNERTRSKIGEEFGDQKRYPSRMREDDFPLRIRMNDKVEKAVLQSSKRDPKDESLDGLPGIKIPVRDPDTSSESNNPAPFPCGYNAKARNDGDRILREGTISSKAAKPAVEGKTSPTLGERNLEMISEARRHLHASITSQQHDPSKERNRLLQSSSDTKVNVSNWPLRNTKAGTSHETALMRRVLSRASPEDVQKDTSDLSLLGAGELLQTHARDSQYLAGTSSYHLSRKRTPDGQLKSQGNGQTAAILVSSGSVLLDPAYSNCERPTNAKISGSSTVDRQGKSWETTKSALGWLSRKLTGRPLSQTKKNEINEFQEHPSRVPVCDRHHIESKTPEGKSRKSHHLPVSRAAGLLPVPSEHQAESFDSVDDLRSEGFPDSRESLSYSSDILASPQQKRSSIHTSSSSASSCQQPDNTSDKSPTSFVPTSANPSTEQSSSPRARKQSHPTFLTTDVVNSTKRPYTHTLTGSSVIEAGQEILSKQPTMPLLGGHQVSAMSAHPGTKGRPGERTSQKPLPIARPIRSSRLHPHPSSNSAQSASLSNPPTNRRPTLEATGQHDSNSNRHTVTSLLTSIHPLAESTRQILSEEVVSLSKKQTCAGLAGLAGRANGMMRPYLSLEQRNSLIDNNLRGISTDSKQNLSTGAIVHTDFTEREIEVVERIVCKLLGVDNTRYATSKAKDRLMHRLNLLSDDQWQGVLRHVQHGKQFQNRDNDALLRFFKDATAGHLPICPVYLELAAPVDQSPPKFRGKSSVSTLLRLRELGTGQVRKGGFSARRLNEDLVARTCERLEPWRSYTGASNDVMVVAWSSDGNRHAAGASAESSTYNMQYNRRNNLLLGDLESNVLVELPNHRIDRPLPSTIADGPNSLQATYDACDPMLYITLTGVQFSATGHRLYTSSYDHTVKVWDVSQSSETKCIATLQHKDEVELIALSDQYHNVLTTGTRVLEKAIRVYSIEDENDAVASSRYLTLCSSRAMKYPLKEIYPSSLRWGISPQVHGYLLAGFSPRPKNEELETDDPPPDGDLCLWDVQTQQAMKVSPCSQNIFDCVWHPTRPFFATGSTCGGGIVDRNSRSVVRVYEPINQPGMTVEYECPALDMNDVTFCPNDPNYITAGCTDGVTYVWDYRKPDKVLHKLEHGCKFPITPLKPGLTREQSDMGVRMALWGKSGNIFYSGSSDGVIKAWNINYSPEDVHLHDVVQLQAGIMCGAFSPDYSNLLVGDSRGAVHILSAAPISTAERVEEIRLQRSARVDAEDQSQSGAGQGTEMADAARALLDSGELEMHPIYGAGKGPNYKGPYAKYARAPGVDPTRNPLLRPEIQAQQLSSKQKALAGPNTVLTYAERRNRRLQRGLAKVRNTFEVQTVNKDAWVVGGGRLGLGKGKGKRGLGKESPLHHASDDDDDDDREIGFWELPETSDEEGESEGCNEEDWDDPMDED
ncbi:MAG: hypothetical protein M1835_001459 [Candelina submexicana]|nr:MAG: hypothetical protein M1835_001459 [Candelina submexicana]